MPEGPVVAVIVAEPEGAAPEVAVIVAEPEGAAPEAGDGLADALDGDAGLDISEVLHS